MPQWDPSTKQVKKARRIRVTMCSLFCNVKLGEDKLLMSSVKDRISRAKRSGSQVVHNTDSRDNTIPDFSPADIIPQSGLRLSLPEFSL